MLRLLDSLKDNPQNYSQALVYTTRLLMNSKELDSLEKQQAYEEIMLHLQAEVIRSGFTLPI